MPDLPRLDPSTAAERVACLGRDPLSPFLVGRGLEAVELPGGGLTGLRRLGRYAVMATGPAAPPGAVEEAEALDALLSWLEGQDLTPVFAGIADPAPYQARGLAPRVIADEAAVALDAFTLSGKRMANLRHSVATAGRMGLDVVAFSPEHAEGLAAVSQAWLEAKRGGEFGFTLGQLSRETVERGDIRVALDGAGRVVGFVTWFPFDDGRARVLDLMRRAPDAPNPTMDLLLAESLRTFADQGVERAGLGSVPRSPGAWADRWYASASLRFYKDKFGPEWRELHLVAPPGRRSLGAGWAVFRASAPDGGLRRVALDAVRALRQA